MGCGIKLFIWNRKFCGIGNPEKEMKRINILVTDEGIRIAHFFLQEVKAR
jgi:hypothetical protein